MRTTAAATARSTIATMRKFNAKQRDAKRRERRQPPVSAAVSVVDYMCALDRRLVTHRKRAAHSSGAHQGARPAAASRSPPLPPLPPPPPPPPPLLATRRRCRRFTLHRRAHTHTQTLRRCRRRLLRFTSERVNARHRRHSPPLAAKRAHARRRPYEAAAKTSEGWFLARWRRFLVAARTQFFPMAWFFFSLPLSSTARQPTAVAIAAAAADARRCRLAARALACAHVFAAFRSFFARAHTRSFAFIDGLQLATQAANFLSSTKNFLRLSDQSFRDDAQQFCAQRMCARNLSNARTR